MSIKMTTMVEKSVGVKTVRIHAKVRDGGSYTYSGSDGEVIKDLESEYVPDYFPTQHYGDYWDLEIDLATGQILNWKAPTAEQLESAFSVDQD